MSDDGKICPACRKAYPGSQNFCDADGLRLVAQSTTSDNHRQAAKAEPAAVSNVSQAPVLSKKLRWPKETIAGIAIVGLLVLLVAGVVGYRQSQKLRLTITFAEAHGLKTGDSVYIQGADVGEVTRAEFRDGRFAVDVNVDEHAVHQFRRDSAFFVGYDKLLVNKKCIVVHVNDPTSPPLDNGSTVRGNDSLLEFYLTLVRQKGPAEAKKIYDQLKSLVSDQVGGAGR
jgi:ABC-type transporter Mla subunit MlaD